MPYLISEQVHNQYRKRTEKGCRMTDISALGGIISEFGVAFGIVSGFIAFAQISTTNLAFAIDANFIQATARALNRLVGENHTHRHTGDYQPKYH